MKQCKELFCFSGEVIPASGLEPPNRAEWTNSSTSHCHCHGRHARLQGARRSFCWTDVLVPRPESERPRGDSTRRTGHLLLRRRRRAAPLPASDPQHRARPHHPAGHQRRLRRPADLLLDVHPGAAGQAQAGQDHPGDGVTVRTHHQE